MPLRNSDVIKRVRYHFSGVVQGVGFRPFIYRLAVENNLTGFVQNRPDGVLTEVQGSAASIQSFAACIQRELPPLADITDTSSEEIAPQTDDNFRIIASDTCGTGDVHISPDIAVCSDCLKELFNPQDRRHRYPFINCTNCGPRLTIIKAIPYDRINTSMACFPLCPQCQKEYENPADRRFHAEPNACPICGPKLSLLDAKGSVVETADAIKSAIKLLQNGKVLAIKGLGGFHLSVDAGNNEAVQRLRSRKFREEKPLAIMAKDLAAAKKLAHINAAEEKLLTSPERPIVLMKKKKGTKISEQVAPGVPNLGIMLPYTPLQHLLLEKDFAALVMTSANQVDEPICISNRETLTRLEGIADYFLIHNRDILVRCDDSIAMIAAGTEQLLRRSRGFVPKPIALKESYPEVLALGAQLKATQCILKGRFAFLSPHIGDLETPQARDFFHESLRLMRKITETDPLLMACDYHPAYYSTKAASELTGIKVIRVQHHHAHIVSCMAENQIDGDVIGLAMDGTGFGLDGNAWGGEFLVANETEFKRLGHLQYFVLPGGEKAIHEPWRIAVSLLVLAYGQSWPEIATQLGILPAGMDSKVLSKIIENKINSPLTSGLGRLFDGVAAIIGLRKTVSFEGQAAMELEGESDREATEPYPFAISKDAENCLILDISSTIRAIVNDLLAGKSKKEISSSFHQTLTLAFVTMCEKIREKTGVDRVCLSGGCFQNKFLLEDSISKLANAGFEVYNHKQVPTNDGGIALGQAVIAGAIAKKGV